MCYLRSVEIHLLKEYNVKEMTMMSTVPALGISCTLILFCLTTVNNSLCYANLCYLCCEGSPAACRD